MCIRDSNMAARSMKTNRTYNIGVLFVDERQSGLAHEYFSAVLDSFKVRVEQLGYDITFINRNLGGRTMTYLEHCHYRGVDGAVIACVDFTDPQVIELVNSDVPVVTIDHVFNLSLIHISEPTRRTPISYAVFCLKKKKKAGFCLKGGGW